MCPLHITVQTVIDYLVDFHTAAANSAKNEAALFDTFYQGLSDRLKDSLASQDLPKTLSKLMDLVTQLDSRFRECQHEKSGSFQSSFLCPRHTRLPPTRHPVNETQSKVSGPSDSNEPMQLLCSYYPHACHLRGVSEDSASNSPCIMGALDNE